MSQHYVCAARVASVLLVSCVVGASACPAFAEPNVLWEEPFAIEYADGAEETAHSALNTLSQALHDLDAQLPAGPEPIRIVICDSMWEFRKYAGRYAQPGVTGIARSEHGIIAVKAPHLIEGGGDFNGILRHELIHVLLARNTSDAYLPRWLNEGLAMRLSREHRWNSIARVAYMYLDGRIIDYRYLNSQLTEPGVELGFSDAYAQSLSMTNYLADLIGEERLWKVVHALEHETFGNALRAHAGMSPPEFFDKWRGSLWKFALVFSIVSGFGLFQIMALLTIWGYLRKRRLGQEKLRQWEEEEADGFTYATWDEVARTEGPDWDDEEGDEDW